MSHVKSTSSLLENYSNLAHRRLFNKAQKKNEKLANPNPISKLTRIRKLRVPEDIPDYIKKQDLDEDSLLTIDVEYNPHGQVKLYFEKFTREVCHYKHKIARKLIRNLKITDQAHAHSFNKLYEIILAMDNIPHRIHTLVPFE